ncbi:MAG: single-stranded-DNA-specific exonuclease RecJ [Bacillota bacterium]
MRPERKKSRDELSSFFEVTDWRLPSPLDPALVDRFARDAGVIPEVASILLRRSGFNPQGALSLLQGTSEPDAPVRDPLLLPGMLSAVERLQKARELGEHVVVYSDFDCDGVTSAALLTEALELAGFEDFEVYFPSRSLEGYGFHKDSALELARKGASLFVTSDCGISGHAACEALLAMGKGVIVTDHHLPQDQLPRAVAVIDPHLPEWEDLGLKGLSGAGVAYLLSMALHAALGVEAPSDWAHDLLTLSVAGDGQPVTGPNRLWIRSGLRLMNEKPRPGIGALMKVAGLGADKGTGLPSRIGFDRDVTFGLVPRINAAGRLSDPRMAFELLTTRDPGRAADLASELDALNRQRKEIEDRILEECWEDLPDSGYAMCAHRPGWHEGVIGIACSRVREATGRPVALVGGEGDTLKGSVRGVDGFNVVAALRRCAEILAAYGGHEAAGGFSVRKDRVDEFFRAFCAVSGEMLEESVCEPTVSVDEVFPVRRVTDEALRSLFGIEPFGDGNPMPQIACMDCEVVHIGLMGSSLDHLQLALGKDGTTQRFLWFGQGRNARRIALLGSVDVLFTPYRSVYRGSEQFSPLVREIRASWAENGLMYERLARATPEGSPVILYTWSEHAGRSLVTALRKLGRAARLHLKGQAGPGALEARACLRGGGVVVSTAPWDLGVRLQDLELKGQALGIKGQVSVMMVHRPLCPEDAQALAGFVGDASPVEARLWRDDAENWLSWTYPDKDRLRCLWKFLTRNYPGGRVPICDVGRRWAEALEAAGYPQENRLADGGRLFLDAAFTVFEQVGLASYDNGRRLPEFVLRLSGDRVDLESSLAFRLGEETRRVARACWQDEVEG